MADAQESLHVNGFYMMLLTSVVINLTETWGVDHGKIANVDDIEYPRTACVRGGTFFCAETMWWYAYHTPSFVAIAIFATYCAAYNNSVVVFAALAASLVAVGWEFPFLSNHSNLYVFMSLFALMLFTPPLGATTMRGGGGGDAIRQHSKSRLAAMKTVLGCGLALVYIFAGFHKLNTDFIQGCGKNFLFRYYVHYWPSWLSAKTVTSLIKNPYVYVPINVSVVWLELISGVALFFPSVAWIGILGAVFLHTMVSIISFYDFAAVALAVLYIILPITDDNRTPFKPFSFRGRVCDIDANVVHYGIVTLVTTFVSLILNLTVMSDMLIDDCRGFTFLFNAFFILRRFLRAPHRFRGRIQLRPRRAKEWLPLCLLALFGMSNYLGLRTAGTFSMFSNLRTEGSLSNHYVLGANPLKIFGYQDDVVTVTRWPETMPLIWRQMVSNPVLPPGNTREESMTILYKHLPEYDDGKRRRQKRRGAHEYGTDDAHEDEDDAYEDEIDSEDFLGERDIYNYFVQRIPLVQFRSLMYLARFRMGVDKIGPVEIVYRRKRHVFDNILDDVYFAPRRRSWEMRLLAFRPAIPVSVVPALRSVDCKW